MNQVYNQFAQQTGRTAQSLTAFEKRQLLLNEVIARGAQITGTYEAALQDSFKQFTSLRRLTEEAVKTFGEQFIPVFEKVVKVTGDWLKAFVAGQTAIGPRFLAVVAAATTALSAFAIVVGGVAAAYAAFLVAANPVTIVLTALGVLIAGGVALWTNYQLEVAGAEQRLKDVEKQAENTAQALFDANKSLEAIRALDKVGGLNKEELKKLQVEAKKLARLFPKLADKIKEAVNDESPRKLLEVFEVFLPQALNNADKNIEESGKKRIQAEKAFRDALLQTFLAEQGFDKERLAATRKRIKDQQDVSMGIAVISRDSIALNKALTNAQDKTNEALKNGSEEYINQHPLIVQNNEDLKKFGDTIRETERSITQLRQAKLTGAFQEFQIGLKKLEQAGNQANQIIGKLQSQRDRIFKNTNLRIVRDFEKAQAQIIAIDIESEASIATRTAAQINEAEVMRDRSLKALQRNRIAQTVTETEFADQKAEILRKFESTKTRIEALDAANEERRAQAIASLSKAQSLASENVTKALEKQERATARLLDQAQLEATGIGPRLLRIRRRFLEQTDRLTRVNEELSKSFLASLDTIRKNTGLTFKEVEQVISGAIDPKILAPQTRQLVQRFAAITRAIDANKKELLAREKAANQEFERERKRLSDRLIAEQKRLNSELLKITNPKAFKESTIESLKQITETFKKQAEDTQSFIRQQQTQLTELGMVDARVQNQILQGQFKTVDEFEKALARLRTGAVPGITKIRDEFEKFRDAAKQATTETDLDKISRIFSVRLADQIRASQFELKKLETQLREFQKIGRPKKERDQRIANQRLFNELVDQGVPILKARQEIQRREVTQRKELNTQEEELQRKVNEQRNAQRKLIEERTALESQFQTVVKAQTDEIARQVTLRQKLLELQKQEIANINQQLAKNKEAQQTLGKFAKGGLKPSAPTPPGTEAPAAPTGGKQGSQALANNTKQLTKEARLLASTTEKDVQTVRDVLATTNRALIKIRSNAEEKIKAQEAWIAARTAELEAGRQKMRQANLVRQKR